MWALKRDMPELEFSLNGGVEGCHQAAAALAHAAGDGDAGARIHGVMIGRAAFHAPWACLSDADAAVFGAPRNAAASRREVLQKYAEYGDGVLGRFGSKEGGAVRYPSVRTVAKPLLGLFHGSPGGRRWRNVLDQELLKKPATLSAALEVCGASHAAMSGGGGTVVSPSSADRMHALQAAMRTLHANVLDAPPETRPAQPAFALGALPQPGDRAGAARTTGKRKSAEVDACDHAQAASSTGTSLVLEEQMTDEKLLSLDSGSRNLISV